MLSIMNVNAATYHLKAALGLKEDELDGNNIGHVGNFRHKEPRTANKQQLVCINDSNKSTYLTENTSTLTITGVMHSSKMHTAHCGRTTAFSSCKPDL